jgi:pantoate--beta-alanine ligase
MALEIATIVAQLRPVVRQARERSLTIGFVPTMGALHAGHASLIQAARRETGFVVVSLFVNPAQFGPNEDFQRYPRPWEADVAICRAEGADVIFAPAAEEVYRPGFGTVVEVTKSQDVLCGPSRPGHFRGVATVVLKLFNMVQPDAAYFGQKDAQQTRIIQQLVRDLDLPIDIRVCPIVREPDGLAISSRNRYLSPDERKNAVVLYQSLQEARQMADGGERDAKTIRDRMAAVICAAPGAAIDYVELVDNSTLQPVTVIQGEVLAAVAVKFGQTRLIDNVVLRGL